MNKPNNNTERNGRNARFANLINEILSDDENNLPYWIRETLAALHDYFIRNMNNE